VAVDKRGFGRALRFRSAGSAGTDHAGYFAVDDPLVAEACGKFDLAFNLCECIDGIAAYEPAVISVLEVLSVPYTGSSSWTTAWRCSYVPVIPSCRTVPVTAGATPATSRS